MADKRLHIVVTADTGGLAKADHEPSLGCCAEHFNASGPGAAGPVLTSPGTIRCTQPACPGSAGDGLAPAQHTCCLGAGLSPG